MTISILPDRAKSFFDFRHCGTFLSVGAVIENIRTEAAAAGFVLEVSRPGREPAAVVRLVADSGVRVADSRVRAVY
ncbi:MAG TPA: hypothetical protein ENO21_04315, partial [Firmicutes bacterium]|nr:hypothetical protein [Bacillota bacterium]